MYSADIIENIIKRGENLLEGQKEVAEYPNAFKTLKRLWNAREVGQLLDKTSATIARTAADLITKGDIPAFDPEQKHPTSKQVLGYTLSQVNGMRAHYGLMPSRDPLLDDCLLLAIQTFKGGVGKSMTTAHLAQTLASKGYKVCVVDMDPQASLTSLFGYVADLQIDLEDTLTPFFRGEQPNLKYAVRKTYWDGLDLIPSQLMTNDNDIMLALKAADTHADDRIELVFNKLRRGLEHLKTDYDVIILDCPPALGMVTMNILSSTDAMIIPTPPALFDFSSTLQYLRMVHDIITRVDPDKTYKFIKILRTKTVNKWAPNQFSAAMESCFGQYLLPCKFPHLQEIENAAVEFKTLLEDRRPNKKALAAVENVGDYIELEIIKTWPSKAMQAAELEKKLNAREAAETNKKVKATKVAEVVANG